MWLFGTSGMARWAMGLDGWTENFDRALGTALIYHDGGDRQRGFKVQDTTPR
jgi:hypothetical protein